MRDKVDTRVNVRRGRRGHISAIISHTTYNPICANEKIICCVVVLLFLNEFTFNP
jgi:hypothetical protein